MAQGNNKLVLFAALGANLGIAVAKFVAAAFTGSSAMLTEGFHSVVDSTNQILLLYGERASNKPADEIHPLGYGREIYFWSFVVAILIFATGAGLSIYEGISASSRHPPIEDATIAYVVLGIRSCSKARRG
jgi:cation diffusion facilitator family transporter